jgi:toxin ParE1/3/4
MSRYVINILASRDLTEIADYFTENSLEAESGFFVNSTASASNSLPSQTAVKATQKFVQTSEDCPWTAILFSTGCWMMVLRFCGL